jgi:peroxiredoxin
MPEFRRPTLMGAVVDTKQLKNRVVVVKFFAKYCEPCKATLPAVQKFYERRHETAFVVGIAVDEHEEDSRQLVSSYGLTFPVVFDRENVLAGRFRVQDLPATFVIDKGGVVRWVGGPERSADELVRAIESFE